VVVGAARLRGHSVLFAAEEGQFMGGAVDELHGAKIVGLLARAREARPAAVVFMIDSGGVRLHEANAGLIAISEIMRAVLDARAAGVPVIALIGGICGAFGGMGIVAKLCSHVIMSEEGRLALSGPDVIETVAGVEEFDARDRALVWRVTGGKHRLLTGDCDVLVEDDVDAFRRAAADAIERGVQGAPTRASIDERQRELAARAARFEGMRDGIDVGRALGVADPEGISMLAAEETMAVAAAVS
jgi:malonate decarboxylase beta subunit